MRMAKNDNTKCEQRHRGAETHTMLLGIQYNKAILGNSLAVSYKIKHILPYDSTPPTPGYFAQRNENLYSHRNMITHVLAALFISSKDWQ